MDAAPAAAPLPPLPLAPPIAAPAAVSRAAAAAAAASANTGGGGGGGGASYRALAAADVAALAGSSRRRRDSGSSLGLYDAGLPSSVPLPAPPLAPAGGSSSGGGGGGGGGSSGDGGGGGRGGSGRRRHRGGRGAVVVRPYTELDWAGRAALREQDVARGEAEAPPPPRVPRDARGRVRDDIHLSDYAPPTPRAAAPLPPDAPPEERMRPLLRQCTKPELIDLLVRALEENRRLGGTLAAAALHSGGGGGGGGSGGGGGGEPHGRTRGRSHASIPRGASRDGRPGGGDAPPAARRAAAAAEDTAYPRDVGRDAVGAKRPRRRT